jgi:hypothetical protein
MGNCLGNNPKAPYILPVLPLWRDEYVDRTTRTLFGPVPSGYAANYRLAEREAIVILAKLPPEGAYFGVQSYVFTRKGKINTSDAVYQWLKQDFPPMAELLFVAAPDPKARGRLLQHRRREQPHRDGGTPQARLGGGAVHRHHAGRVDEGGGHRGVARRCGDPGAPRLRGARRTRARAPRPALLSR